MAAMSHVEKCKNLFEKQKMKLEIEKFSLFIWFRNKFHQMSKIKRKQFYFQTNLYFRNSNETRMRIIIITELIRCVSKRKIKLDGTVRDA